MIKENVIPFLHISGVFQRGGIVLLCFVILSDGAQGLLLHRLKLVIAGLHRGMRAFSG